jgi:hypothetical protein
MRLHSLARCSGVVLFWIAIGTAAPRAQVATPPASAGEPTLVPAAWGTTVPAATPQSALAPFEAPKAESDRPRLSGRVAFPLYSTFIATQALDLHSTLRAIDAGYREANRMVRWATNSPATFITLKAATTATSILLVDRLRRNHPKPALFLLVGLNTTSAVVVAHNYHAPAARR